ncbi:MAG: hypothetical protein AB7Q45_17485 [Planctomycetaceae bacterium]
MKWISFSIAILGLAASPVAAQSFAPADSPATPPAVPAKKTIIEFELLGDGPLRGGLVAHEWAETLQKIGADVQVRQPRPDDEVGVTEKTRGTLRWVKVVGLLNSSGNVVLPGREFSRSDTGLLREWIAELKLYGALGAPDGKPLWGLSESQFKTLFSALSAPIAADGDGEPLMTALLRMHLPPEHPVRFHSTATQHLSQMARAPAVRQRLAGMSCGTGLAAVLADCGLGFRPLRNPAGEIELVVQPLADLSDPWPVGWDLHQDMRRHELAPALFKMAPVQFDEVPLQDVLDAIAIKTEIPIIIDRYAVEQKGIDLAASTLSYPSKRIAWIQVIHSVAVRNGMTEKLKIDENSRPFLHVAPFTARRSSE